MLIIRWPRKEGSLLVDGLPEEFTSYSYTRLWIRSSLRIFAKCLDLLDQRIDLLRRKLVCILRHVSFAVADDVAQIFIRCGVHLIRTQRRPAEMPPGCIFPMTLHAMLLVDLALRKPHIGRRLRPDSGHTQQHSRPHQPLNCFHIQPRSRFSTSTPLGFQPRCLRLEKFPRASSGESSSGVTLPIMLFAAPMAKCRASQRFPHPNVERNSHRVRRAVRHLPRAISPNPTAPHPHSPDARPIPQAFPTR